MRPLWWGILLVFGICRMADGTVILVRTKVNGRGSQPITIQESGCTRDWVRVLVRAVDLSYLSSTRARSGQQQIPET